MAKPAQQTQFPNWAPKELCELRAGLGPSQQPFVAKLLDRLLVDPRMEKVWTALAKRYRDSLGPRTLLNDLVAEEKMWRVQAKLSTAALLDTYREIARLAAPLAELLDGRLSDPSVEQLSNFVDLDEIRQCLNPDATPGISSAEVNQGTFSEELQRAYAIAMALPPLKDVLTLLAKRAKKNLIGAKGLPQPNNPSARAHHMTKELHAWFRLHYNAPLYDHVATIVNTLLNADEDAETVRLRLQQFKRRRRSKERGTSPK